MPETYDKATVLPKRPLRTVLFLAFLVVVRYAPLNTGRASPARTSKDPEMSADRALELLKMGNIRYIMGRGRETDLEFRSLSRNQMVANGQSPIAAVLGCADSRVPVEVIFDAQPGEIFVLRNAGNTLTHAEGSMVGSLEFGTGPLRTKLVVVMGHTKCGAIAGATKAMLALKKHKAKVETETELESLLHDLAPSAAIAAAELRSSATVDEITARAVRVNVFRTMDGILQRSEALREKVRSGEVKVLGAVYDLETGKVEFLGPSPRQEQLVG